jgi:hypothetical protein
MPYFSPPVPSENLQLPGGRTFRGGKVGWATCPFDYTLEAAAADASGRVDGTPVVVDFLVGGPPAIDSVAVPAVIVFVPSCPEEQQICPQVDPRSFGPDTLLVFGEHVPDALAWETPLGLGWNDFVFPFRAWAHDDARDRNPAGGPPYYTDEAEGRVRAWQYAFDCTAPGCEDVALPLEGVWRADVRGDLDPPGQQVFDNALHISVPLDTLCVDDPCSLQNLVGVAPTSYGEYIFAIEARDSDVVGQRCAHPSDLGPNPATFSFDLGPHGRVSAKVSVSTEWVQLSDVRPVR